MAEMMQFDLVSPERRLASMQVSEVQIPGAEGDLTAMADHMPVITTLRPGILRAISAEGPQEFIVSGGFAEISPKGTSVLAELAVARADATREFLERLRSQAEEAQAKATPETQDAAAKTVADLTHLMQDMV